MLRDRRVLIALVVAVLLGLRFWPLLPGQGLGPPSLALPGLGSVSKPGNQAVSTVQPSVIDPQSVKEPVKPFLVLRAAAVRSGAPLVVGGEAFQPNQSLTVTLLGEGEDVGVKLGTVTSDKNGVLPDASLPLPAGLHPGSYLVAVAPTRGGPSAEASLEVEPDQPWAKLSVPAAKPGETLGYEGGGFQQGETVALHLDNLGSSPVATSLASDGGTVSGDVQLPMAGEGDHTLLFLGEQSQMPAAVGVNVMGFRPWVVLDNYSPLPEQAVGFSGSDFAPGEEVFVFLNELNSSPASVVGVGADGTFNVPAALALSPATTGAQKLIFVGNQSQTSAEVEFAVQPYAVSLELTAYAGPPGSEVAFTGSGLARGEEVRAYLGKPADGRRISAFQADDKGSFVSVGGFRVPRDTKDGKIALAVVGQVSGAEASVSFTVVPLSPWAEVQQDQTGAAVVAGHGFALGEEVVLSLGQGNDTPVSTALADQEGDARFDPLSVPPETEGATQIRLKGRESGGEAKVEFYGSSPPEGGEGPGTQDHGTLEFEPVASPTASELPRQQGR